MILSNFFKKKMKKNTDDRMVFASGRITGGHLFGQKWRILTLAAV
jgi:hypothetical protein